MTPRTKIVTDWPVQQAYRVEPVELPPWYVVWAQIIAYSLAVLIGGVVVWALLVALLSGGTY